ncbi:MAG TPA: hypothetical protein VMW12_05420 [Candidatus Dormibacteraeota bacterium]|nr:hypothetical protein [Candidatus Dormibacteraeota bacterium]
MPTLLRAFVLCVGTCAVGMACSALQHPRAALALVESAAVRAPSFDAIGNPITIVQSRDAAPPSAALATFLPDLPGGAGLKAFSLATAQTVQKADEFWSVNPAAIHAVYFSSLRFDTAYRPPNPNSYLPWMQTHEQDFVHVGDPGMLSGERSGLGCAWTWLPDARQPQRYNVYGRRGELLASTAATDHPSALIRASARIFVNSVLDGNDVPYTSIDNRTGSRVPASCQDRGLVRPVFTLPSRTPDSGGMLFFTGSVDSIGSAVAPRLEYLYHPRAESAIESVPMRGGPTHWAIATGLPVGGRGHWFGSVALRYCSENGCTDWWVDNPNNRAAFPRYNDHTWILNDCSPQERSDAIRMIGYLHQRLNNDAIELDDIVDTVARLRPETYPEQNPSMWTNADVYRCDSVEWPRSAHAALAHLGIKTILNGGPQGADFSGDGRIYEDVPWSAGVGGPYPATLAGWRRTMSDMLADLRAGRIVWMIPTGNQNFTSRSALARQYSFAVYELLKYAPFDDRNGGLYYGISALTQTTFPDLFVGLGPPAVARPRSLAQLFDSSVGMYARRYANATVFVCPPGSGGCQPVEFKATRYALSVDTNPESRTLTPINRMALAPGQAAIVLDRPS